jgi:hypothetical protein
MGFVAREEHLPDLFDNPKNTKLVRAIDGVNEKFGKGALIYGDSAPGQTSKIAFQRVPKAK